MSAGEVSEASEVSERAEGEAREQTSASTRLEPSSIDRYDSRRGGSDARWTRAGKEPGCLFYFIFHTGFVGAEQALHVPLHMMDRACKNAQGHFQPEGEATLAFDTLQETPAIRAGMAMAASSSHEDVA